MAHYRKIDISIWLDEKFNALSSDSQFVFLYLLTHPQLTALGAMRSTVPGLAAELNWPLERFETAFKALCQQALIAIDKKACFVWAMNFLKYNPPESPNVVKSWGTCLAYLPECALKNQLIQKTHLFLETLSLGFKEALPACFELTTPIVKGHAAAINTFSQDNSLSSLDLPVTLDEALPQTTRKVQESPQDMLPKVLKQGLAKGFPKDFQEGLAKTCLNHKTLNIKHKTVSIKQEQKENNLLLEKTLEEKLTIEEINNIVVPARQKNAKLTAVEDVDELHCPPQTPRRLGNEGVINSLGEGTSNLCEGLGQDLNQGFGKTFVNPSASLVEDLRQVLLMPVHAPPQAQKSAHDENAFLQQNYAEKKEPNKALKHSAMPIRQKSGMSLENQIVEVFRYWQETLAHPHAVLDTKRRKRIREALASGYKVAQLCDAILGCSYTPHNIGHNDQGQRYDGLHIIFRDADQIDRFIRNAHSPPRPQNAADKLENTNWAATQRWLHKKTHAHTEKVINEPE